MGTATVTDEDNLLDQLARVFISRNGGWRRRAACAGAGKTDNFYAAEEYPERYADRSADAVSGMIETATRRARLLCGTCPVKDECLDDALETRDEYGIRGGLTAVERRTIRRRRQRGVGVGRAQRRCPSCAGPRTVLSRGTGRRWCVDCGASWAGESVA